MHNIRFLIHTSLIFVFTILQEIRSRIKLKFLKKKDNYRCVNIHYACAEDNISKAHIKKSKKKTNREPLCFNISLPVFDG